MISEKIPERGWIPLYALFVLGRIPTRTKMQKLVFLVQTEGRISGYRFFKNHYGPFSDELEVDLGAFSTSLGLMQTQIVDGMRYPYYLYESTKKGRELGKELSGKLPPNVLQRAEGLIRKYGNQNYQQLLEYVYKKYVIPEETFDDVFSHLSDDLMSLENIWSTWYKEDCPASFLMLAVVEYISKALSKVKDTKDQVLHGVCASCISELTGKLVDLTSNCKTIEKCPFTFRTLFSEISDQIGFLDQYCGKHGIIGSISEIDFSDFIDEEELKRLEDVLAKTRPSELMY